MKSDDEISDNFSHWEEIKNLAFKFYELKKWLTTCYKSV